MSRGLIAVGSGDARAAKKFTTEAVRIAPREPLTLLLSAQTAQLSGDRDAAVATFQEMADRDDTRVLGLHGLFVEAQRRHDHAAAILARSEAKAARGDVAGATAELGQLPPNVRAPAEAWIKSVQARAAAIDASRRLAADALARLSK